MNKKRMRGVLFCIAFSLSAACSGGPSKSLLPGSDGPQRTKSLVNTNTNPPDNGGGCADAYTCGSGTNPTGGSGGGGGSTGGTTVATQGPATQGKSCSTPNGSSATIGSPVEGPDIPANEVNNAFLIVLGSSNDKGSLAGNGGFFVTTIGGTTWLQTPSIAPVGVVFVSMGNNFGISPNAPMGISTYVNLVSNALSAPGNSGLAIAAKNAVTNWLSSASSKGNSAYVDPCFNGPWDGSAGV